MSLLRVFVSSTCYDLHAIRAQIRSVIQGLGHEPVMSDYMEVLYNPAEHTHESCVKEVESCDVVVLVIGSRYGGAGIPAAIEHVDLERLEDASYSTEVLKDKENLSITQLEICKAIEESIPVFAFVTSQVWHDHRVYEANKSTNIINELRFPSIENANTSRYIFEFINFLRHRTSNNHLIEFNRADEIEQFLKRQWSQLFQRLLEEQRTKEAEQRRLDLVSSELADLKAAIMSSISAPDLRQTARGAIRFRRMIDFLLGLELSNFAEVIKKQISWEDILKEAKIEQIVTIPESRKGPYEIAMVREDGYYYLVRYGDRLLNDLSVDWEAWKKLGEDAKSAILDAVTESGSGGFRIIRLITEPFEHKEPKTTTPDPELPF